MAPGNELSTDFSAGIAAVKLMYNVAERSKIILLVQAVHSGVDGNQPDAFLPQNLHDLTDF